METAADAQLRHPPHHVGEHVPAARHDETGTRQAIQHELGGLHKIIGPFLERYPPHEQNPLLVVAPGGRGIDTVRFAAGNRVVHHVDLLARNPVLLHDQTLGVVARPQ